MPTPKPPIPIWLDCDPGHDDAFAILLTLHHPLLSLLGISTVHGNASLTRTTTNALSLLTAYGAPDHTRVYPGAARPLCREAVHARDIHGETGLDGTELLPDPGRRAGFRGGDYKVSACGGGGEGVEKGAGEGEGGSGGGNGKGGGSGNSTEKKRKRGGLSESESADAGESGGGSKDKRGAASEKGGGNGNEEEAQIPAILAMRNALLSTEKGSAWVVATGALTNVGLLFAAFPELIEWVEGVSIMGGAIGGGFTGAEMGRVDGNEGAGGREGEEAVNGKESVERVGNWTRWAEFNIYCDPEAARSLLENPAIAAKTNLIPLDVTHLVRANSSVLARILHGPRYPLTTETEPSPLRRMLHSLLTFFASTYSSVFSLHDPPVHDPLAVAVILDALGLEGFGFFDRLMTSKEIGALKKGKKDNISAPSGNPIRKPGDEVRWIMQVVTNGEHKGAKPREGVDEEETKGESMLGRTVLVREAGEGEGGIRIPRRIDNLDRFWTVIGDCISKAEDATRGKGIWEGW